MRGACGELVVLLVWWAIWSLLDTYALAATPASEVAILASVAAFLYARRVLRRVRSRNARPALVPDAEAGQPTL